MDRMVRKIFIKGQVCDAIGGKMKPIYAQNIIVAIKNKGKIEWYVLDKEICFLDYNKLERAYQKKGHGITIDASQRFGIKVVDLSTKEEFLKNIEEFKISTEILKKELLREEDYNNKLAYNPSLFIDFDVCELLSHYSEPESFEMLVPNGWKGKYQNFENMIPTAQRYWLSKCGDSLIRR